MRTISISGGKCAVIVGGGTKESSNKVFCWYGMNEASKFEAGVIVASDIEAARLTLRKYKNRGAYKVKEVNPQSEFESFGTFVINK